MTRTRAGGDGEPAARSAKRKKDRRPLAGETSLLTSRLQNLETIVVAQSYRIDILMRLSGVLDKDLVELEGGRDASTSNT